MDLDATHFLLGQHWKNHFTRKAAETGAAVEVRPLRKWVDDPKRMGLPREVENLLILVYAQQSNRSFLLHNAPCDVTLSNIPDLCQLREQKLPGQADWETAVDRAGSIFGLAISPLLNAANLAALVSGVKKQASDRRAACQTYCQKLRERMEKLGLALDQSDRLKTATATWGLVGKLHDSSDDTVVGILQSAKLATSATAMGECLTAAGTLAGTIEGAGWDLFDAIGKLKDDRTATAAEIRQDVAEALCSDEHVKGLAAALKEAQSRAVRLLTMESPAPTPTPVPVPTPTPPPRAGRKLVEQGSEEFERLADARAKLERLEGLITARRHAQVTMTWRIEEEQP
jgi:hypothetical protein